MIKWFSKKNEFQDYTQQLSEQSNIIEKYLSSQKSHIGFCGRCFSISEFQVGPESQEWLNLRESFICQYCGLNSRARQLYQIISDVLTKKKEMQKAFILEQTTPLFRYLLSLDANLIGSEYLSDESEPGKSYQWHGLELRHENAQALSFENESLDFIFHGDIIEHIPCHKSALKEFYRTLKSGGEMIFSAPFFDIEENLIRCEVIDGKIVHHLPKGYHGNPMSQEGSLVYIHPGWEFFEYLKNIGFSKVEIGLHYDPFQGFVSNNNPFPEGHMWPIIFRTVK